MKYQRHTIASLLFLILFVGVLTWLVIQRPDAIIQLKLLVFTDYPGFAVAHFVGLVMVFLLFVFAWRSCVLFLDVRCSWRAASFSWLVPNIGKYLPGKVLMLGGRIELLRRHGVSRSIGSMALLFEHALMLVAVFPFMAGIVLFRGAGDSALGSFLLYGAVMVPLLVVVAFPSLPVSGINLALRKLGKPLVLVTPSRSRLLGVMVLYLLLWTLYGISGWFLVEAMFPGRDLHILQTISAFPTAWLLGFLAIIVPGGVGVREAALVLALSPGLSTDEAISVAIASRLTWTLVEMFGVLVGWMIGISLAKSAKAVALCGGEP
jgi:hypothetical protein